MKTIKQTIERIEEHYSFYLSRRDAWRKTENEYLEVGRKFKAKECGDIADEYQSKMAELVYIYAYILGIDYCDAVRQLHEIADKKESE